MCLPGGHFIPHFLGSLEVGFPPTTKGPGLLPYLYSSPHRSDLFGEERSPACTTQLLVPPVLLAAASPPPPQRKAFCFCWKVPALRGGCLTLNFSMRKAVWGHIKITLSTILCAIKTSFLLFCLILHFVQNTAGPWGGSYCCFSPVINFDGCTF